MLGILVSGCGSDGSSSSGGSAGSAAAGTSSAGGSGGAGQSGGSGGSVAAGGSGVGGAGGNAGSGGAPAGFEPGPYRHVRPEGVGVYLGAGSIAPPPTETYTGPLDITEPTTLENVRIDGCVRIESDDVVLRNVHISCDGLYPVRAEGHADAIVEHSTIECASNSKVFLVSNFRNLTVRYNDISGCEDFFFVGGDVDGLKVEHNYMHHLNLTSESHADGFQIGEAANTTGSIDIVGNWIGPEADGGKTDTLFATNQCNATIRLESNFFKIWGLRTLRCGGEATSCSARTNVYEQAFEVMERPGVTGKLLFYMGSSSGSHSFECNRLQDGSFPPETLDFVDRVAGADHVTDGCPDWPF